jgi:23S rRNA pseudouridine1911/1915/1917 synthase
MTKKYLFEIDLEDSNIRLDCFLKNIVPELSRTRVQELITGGVDVLVNDKPSKNSYKLKYSDKVAMHIPEAKPLEIPAENIPLDIRFENDFMLVVNKPKCMLTHPTSQEREHTLVNALLYHCKDSLSGINGIMRPGILHRLDRDTSGLLMIAKNDFAHQFLAEQIRTRTAKRLYAAVILGVLKEDTGTINAPIDRDFINSHKMKILDNGKPSITHWRVLERFKKFTFIEAALETGRTHQIRVHFSYIGHPVAGDALYGGKNIKINLNGQALQSYKLSFIEPQKSMHSQFYNEGLTPFLNFEKINIAIDYESDITKLMRILREEKT